jgi:D-3-phosphoglycerate dehydrogenase / 2-oxoglutarate reductase
MKQVLFLDSVHEILSHRLTRLGYTCLHAYKLTLEELLPHLEETNGIVVRSRIPLNRHFMDLCPNLKWIARSGSGLENIDVDYAHSRKILIFNSPEGNRDSVGEQTIGMLLMLLNNMKTADTEVRRGKWRREENRGHELVGKTVGIIGFGIMGSGVAQKLVGFGCKVIAHDKYKKDFGCSFVSEVSLETLYEQSDIVSLHLPLNTETTHYADGVFFSKFKKPIYFINTSRGKNLKTAALVQAMKEGRVLGACLDVLEYEKSSLEGLEFNHLPEDLQWLIQSENTILTPHIAGWTHESYFKLSNVLADKIEDALESGLI